MRPGALLRRLRRDQRGQSSVELIGVLPLLFLVVLVVWQLALATWAVNQASNAARTVSRVNARGGDLKKTARNAVSPALRHGLKYEVRGEKATVRVRIPIVIPGLTTERLVASRSAELPK
jgi:Flp pilus assembly protein TadG